MTKAVHEAKINLSWLSQDQEYVDHLNQFIDRILSPGTSRRPNPFPDDFQQFVKPIFFFGAINGLAQVLLKLTSPGVPDIYRGTELWDFSLVDPDNRRPVDYAQRQRVLRDLQETENNGGAVSGLMSDLSDGRAKMWTIMRTLTFRREHPELFKAGSEYVPLFADAHAQEHVIAYARRREGQMTIALAPRFPYTMMKGEMRLPIGDAWGETTIDLPPGSPAEFTNVLTGEPVRAHEGRLLGREVFASFPIALLSNV
jgi:(1->4)-alpha-D-glucan 1-alpha-D-glucosylmutase